MAQSPWSILPYTSKKIRDRYLVATPWGGWTSLDRREFNVLNSLSVATDKPLLAKLKSSHIVIGHRNLDEFLEQTRQLKSNLFNDAGLHIAVVTDRCNYACAYCQAKKVAGAKDMDFTVATRVLAYLFASRNPVVRLELQGGEPLLNWPTVVFLVKHSRKQNKMEKKQLEISLVTNMSLLNKDKMDFLIDHDVEFCTSLDGPAEIHDKNRPFANGSGTHDAVCRGIEAIRACYKKKGTRRKISALPTITRRSLKNPRGIIDEYVKMGLDSIHLRELNPIGLARLNWSDIGYTPADFAKFWEASLDYIIEINRRGILFAEESAVILLKKILMKRDPYYVDLDSPCGAGRGQLAYAPNGDVYTCDEARMLGGDVFRLGNMLKEKYEDLVKHENLFYTSQASLLNLWDYNSPYAAWSGTCPVINYLLQGSPVVKIHETPKQKINTFKLDYIFDKIFFDKAAMKIFRSWLNHKEPKHEKK